jgi:WD40 repeat protein
LGQLYNLTFFFLFIVVTGDFNSSQIDLYDSINNVKVKSFTGFHSDRILFLKYLPLNGYVVSCSADTSINIWNPNTGESIQKFTRHTHWVYGLDQIEDDVIVSVSWDKTIQIWKISTGEIIKTIDVNASIYAVKVLSNKFQQLIACGLATFNNSIKIFNYTTGELVKTLNDHTDRVTSIEILNEQFAASGGWDFRVNIWDFTNYSIKYTLIGHENKIYCVKRLSSSLIASGDINGVIIIWNWLNGERIYTLKGHTAQLYVTSLDLYDEQTLISDSEDGTIKFWNISNGDLIQSINTNYPKDAIVMLKTGK